MGKLQSIAFFSPLHIGTIGIYGQGYCGTYEYIEYKLDKDKNFQLKKYKKHEMMRVSDRVYEDEL